MAVADSVRAALARRAQYRCEYCGYPEAASSTPREVDHIIPEARGGRTTLDNLALCCRSWNLYKHVQTVATDPVTGETVSLFNPRAHRR
jgi:5-methylcytosine-specific restriction endonuclease McrA